MLCDFFPGPLECRCVMGVQARMCKLPHTHPIYEIHVGEQLIQSIGRSGGMRHESASVLFSSTITPLWTQFGKQSPGLCEAEFTCTPSLWNRIQRGSARLLSASSQPLTQDADGAAAVGGVCSGLNNNSSSRSAATQRITPFIF